MGNSIFGISVSALNASQAGLVTTQHNIANAKTTGFHRQQIVQSNAIPNLTGYGFVGQGVQVDTVKRIYSEFLDNQVTSAQTQASHLDSYDAQIKQIDNMLADANSGLSPALQDFFNGVQDVASNPASVPSRQAMLSGAQSLVARFQALNQRFEEIRSGVNSQVSSSVTLINSYAKQIASVNESIVLAQSATNDQLPNDLLDQRDALIAQLNQEVKVSVVKQSDGSYNVFIGNGQALVVGQRQFDLRATPALDDPARMDVGYAAGANTAVISPSSLQGGNLGGLLAFRSESLDPAQSALGRVAIGLAQTFNDQHQLGQDLNGALGGNFFTTATLKQPIGNLNNTSGATLAATLSNVSALTTSDYRLQYDGTNYTLLRLSDNAMVYNDTTFPATAIDGFTLSVASGAVATGDSFLIQPTRSGAANIGVAISDPSKVAAAAPIRTSAALANTGSGVIGAGSVTSTANLPLPADVVLTYSSGTNQFTVTGAVPAVANITYTSGSAISFNGLSFDISGAPANGDVFTISRNTGGVSDNRNALLLQGLQTQNTMAGGTATYQGVYSQLVSQVGNKAREVQVAAKAQANLVTQTKQAAESLSGVNLDEEAANLIRYQQAYQAAGKAMQIATTLFDTLLAIGN